MYTAVVCCGNKGNINIFTATEEQIKQFLFSAAWSEVEDWKSSGTQSCMGNMWCPCKVQWHKWGNQVPERNSARSFYQKCFFSVHVHTESLCKACLICRGEWKVTVPGFSDWSVKQTSCLNTSLIRTDWLRCTWCCLQSCLFQLPAVLQWVMTNVSNCLQFVL